MRRLGVLSIIFMLTISSLIIGCGSSPPAVESATWRERAKPLGEMDRATFGYQAEVADYPELTEAAALELFRSCQAITGLGFSQQEWPVNIVKSFKPEQFCNVYTIADSWLFMDVRTSDARITSLKNCRAGQAQGVVRGLGEADALARAQAVRASFEAAEEAARQASPGVNERQQLLYHRPSSNGWQVTANTGSWSFFWKRAEIHGIPYHVEESYFGEGIRLTQRVDGLFLEYTTRETMECEATKPVIRADAAQATAQPLIDRIQADSLVPVPSSTVSLAYVVPGPISELSGNEMLERQLSGAKISYQPLAYPDEFRLAWVVSVGPHPWHYELNWVEIWVDALNGEIIGTVRNDLH